MPSLRLLPLTNPLRAATARASPPTARCLLPLPLRPYSSSSSSSSSSSTPPGASFLQPGPSPPRLPAEQQAEFERLQRAVADRLSDPTPLPHERAASAQQTNTTNTSATSSSSSAPSPAHTSRHTTTTGGEAAAAAAGTATTTAAATAARDTLPATGGGVWRGARPEFDGDTNPKTGEVGGPKTEPLRWGSGGDWSYNGRVTDF